MRRIFNYRKAPGFTGLRRAADLDATLRGEGGRIDHSFLYSDPLGASANLVVTLYDQTETLASREAMRVHRERLLAVMNNSTALIALKDPSGRYEFVNARAAEFFGRAVDDMLGRTDDQILPGPIADLLRDRGVIG